MKLVGASDVFVVIDRLNLDAISQPRMYRCTRTNATLATSFLFLNVVFCDASSGDLRLQKLGSVNSRRGGKRAPRTSLD